MSTGVVWTDVIRCPDCGTVNEARDEWCESCLADIKDDDVPVMFVGRWAQRSHAH